MYYITLVMVNFHLLHKKDRLDTKTYEYKREDRATTNQHTERQRNREKRAQLRPFHFKKRLTIRQILQETKISKTTHHHNNGNNSNSSSSSSNNNNNNNNKHITNLFQNANSTTELCHPKCVQ